MARRPADVAQSPLEDTDNSTMADYRGDALAIDYAGAGRDLFTQQEANRKSSRRLVIGFVLFLTWLGFGGDLIWYLASRPGPDGSAMLNTGVHVFPGVGLLVMAIAGVMTWLAFRFGPTGLIKATGAREIETPASEREQRLVNVVEEMSIAAGARKPRVWLIPEPAPNAFATGIESEKAHIAVTEGLLDTCTRQELQAVVGHEMGHVVNLDVKLMTLLTALVGVVALVHNSAFRMMRFGGGRGRSRSKGGGAQGVLVIVLLVVWLISWAIAPLVTRYIAMKVGRSREFLADAMSAQFTRNPGALASALVKISESNVKPTAIPKSSSQLCISDPFHSRWDEKKGRFADLMATHPPLRDRVSRLRQMAYQGPEAGAILQSPLSMSEA
ncbi:MAG TPA: M48 family metalloprotease [Gemmatimonadaceae bacterium]|nr:M48 family metalloprotease [Gemmatimonadaceae bacterium]